MKSLFAMSASAALLISACSSTDGTPDSGSSSSASAASAGGGGDSAGSGGNAGGGDAGGGNAGGGGEGAAPPGDTTERIYDADDSNIQVSGRVDFSDPKKPRFSTPGVTIQASFKGSSVAVTLDDEHKWDKYFNYFDVSVDDGPVTKIQVQPEAMEYEIASDLPYGEHTVTVIKRTEASIGYTELLGFKFGGEIQPPPQRPSRKIEFIGDSISCGSGIDAPNGSPQCEEDGWGQPYHNARLAYGPLVARQLGAEYHVTAVSGIGLVRNYSSEYDARPMPEVYGLLFPELTDSPAWDTARFVPDAIVIALGTNDFSPGDSERPRMDVETYAEAYIDFIDTLRGYYPDAHIFCMSSPMLGDGWPEPTDMSATDHKASLTRVEEHFAANNDTKVHKVFVSKATGKGCGTHPDATEHETMAEELSPVLQSVMGW
ncbi:SGNH/GDSL hydrolase family protein [Sorangium sp. So ce1153]|uniref:SGNH/GDSL hydrolase family protein n=1 Tax=Sorangium sp. So ce1153 TaxID=3133333 RepID=UPI003F5F09CD